MRGGRRVKPTSGYFYHSNKGLFCDSKKQPLQCCFHLGAQPLGLQCMDAGAVCPGRGCLIKSQYSMMVNSPDPGDRRQWL